MFFVDLVRVIVVAIGERAEENLVSVRNFPDFYLLDEVRQVHFVEPVLREM